MLKNNKTPFYLKPPLDVLFKKGKLEKVNPWDVDLVYILATLLEEMEKAGIDFRVAGTALNSSVIIYSKKAELLLKMEEPPEPQEEQHNFYIPPPVPLPFRFELTTTSLQDLIVALEKAIDEENIKSKKPKLPILPLPIPEFLDFEKYLLEVEEKADELLHRIRIHFQGDPIRFSEFIKGEDRMEIVKIFITLLFLAQNLEIDLYQDDEDEEIKIILLEGA